MFTSQTWTKHHYRLYLMIENLRSSGLDKRQWSVQQIIFADGVPHVRPLVTFRGKGLRITHKEQEAWDCRVQVAFQPKTWCEESVMKKWISKQWGNIFINPLTTSSTGKILVADVHRAHQMVSKLCLRKKTPNCLMFPQVVLVRFNLVMFLLIIHLRMLLNNSLRSILRRTCNSILKGKSVPLKEEY